MAITKSGPAYGEKGGNRSKGGVRDYEEHFVVVTNSVNDGTLLVRTSAGIPQIGTPHPADPTAYCVDIQAGQRAGSANVWDVTCRFENTKFNPAASDSSPLSQPPVIRWDGTRFTRYTITEQDGTPITNSAGDLFDPLELDDNRPTVSITRNESNDNPAVRLAYENSINSDTLAIANLQVAPYQAKLSKISASNAYHDGDQYFTKTYELEFKRDTWRVLLSDAGFRAKILNPVNNEYYWHKLTDGPTGAALDRPSLLDGNGLFLKPGLPAVPLPPKKLYVELPFAALGLP